MKTIKLLSIIFIISIISCTKKPNNQIVTRVQTQNEDLSGTWVNTSNATDYYILTNTSNDKNGNTRYILSHFAQYNYDMSLNTNKVDTVLLSTLITQPGYDNSYYTGSPVNSPESYYMLYINEVMSITIKNINNTVTTYTFNKS